MLKGIDHIEIVVRDIDEMVTFFKELGFEEVRRTEHHGGAAEMKLPGPGQVIFEFHTMEMGENPGVNHIAFRVEDSQGTVDALRAKGFRFDKGPWHFAPTNRILTNFRDPQGFRLQFTE